MPAAPVPQEEASRLAALHALCIMDTPPDPEFDAVVQAASLVCGVPIAHITLVDGDRQWHKAKLGPGGARETPREVAFCAYTILGNTLLEVPDARQDARFQDNALVCGPPGIRFYAGVPLLLADGSRIGSLCVIDLQPRCLDDTQRAVLQSLAVVTSNALQNWSIRRKQKQAEEALSGKQRRITDLVAATNIGTWEWNVHSNELVLNERFAGIFGYTLADLPTAPDQTPFSAVHPDDKVALWAKIGAHLAGWSPSCDHEFRMQHRCGENIWVRCHGTVTVSGAHGQPEWMCGMLEDISSRKSQEMALRKNQAFLDEAGRLGGVGGWDLDLLTGELAWSAETCRIHGVDRCYKPTLQEALDFYPPESRPLIEAAVAKGMEGGGGWDLEVPFTRADGKRLWVRAVGSVVESEGKPVRLIGAIQDVTEQVAQRDALQAANERLTLATETAGIGIWEWDIASGKAVWDDRMHKLYDRTQMGATWTYDAWLQILHPDDREKAAEGARRALECHEPLNQSSRIVWQDGTIRYIHGIGRTCRDKQGVVTRMIGVNWDVTEARLTEKERDERERELRIVNSELERTARHLVGARDAADRANRAKSRFLAGMSHELRTPLNGILGYAQLLRLDGGLNEAQSRRVEAMLDAGTHLLDMISSVLELSEIETEHVELRVIEVDLPKIAMASLDLVRPRAQAKGLRLACCADLDAPRSMLTDQTRLRQIILNLLGNAVKFTDTGQVELRLLAVPGAQSLRIQIADTGPGIRQDQRGRLFQDFERLQANVTGMVEGAGLGLALSSRLAALLGGRMGYDDNPGGGSIFWVELPLQAPVSDLAPPPARGEEEPAGLKPAPQPGKAETRRLRVLVVDDVAINRDIACAFLRAAGHETLSVDGGAAAVQAAGAGNIDVVLMDVRMPDVDGLEATRRIRQLAGSLGQVPIIGLTAQAFAEQVLACTQAGMDGHLSKPYTPDALRETVARAACRPSARKSKDALPAQTLLAAEDLPVLDPDAVARMAEYLSPSVIDSYLRTIAARCETMLRALRSFDQAGLPCDEALAEAAHTLAGSAGMLGFALLARNGIAFERALRSRSPETALLADRLAAAIDATLREVHDLPRPKAA